MTDTRPPSERPPRGRRKSLFLKTGLVAGGLLTSGLLALGLAMALAWPSLPDLNAMTDYRPRVPLRIYTADKVLIGEFGEEHRNVLRFDEIPEVMRHAMLAAEDDRFYEHGGIDWTGVARAMLTNLVKMSKTQGASTITMQVARNFYLSSEKTYSRKFYELLLTYKIESELTKDQILELYMNQIYLGHRAYGFAAAARTYFGKKLSELTAAEAAMLAGIPKAPSRANPLTNFQRAKARQGYVLTRMQALGYLTPTEVEQARAEKIVVRGSEGGPERGFAVRGEYPAELVRQLMYGVFREDAYTLGLDVYTTIDSKAQSAAYQAVRTGVLDYTRRAVYPGPEGRVDLPEDIEADTQAFDDILDGIQDEHPDSDGLYAAVVLQASPDSVRVARSANDIVTIDDKKALAVVARALNPKADAKQRLTRGAIVYIHRNGENWEIINMPALQAAMVSLRPQDGAIQAMVGGFDFYRGSFNRVTQAWRQPGSTIKPFLYAAALERGFTPGTQISDQPFTMTAEQTGSRAWEPKNDNNRYEPMMTLREGLYRSRNMVSIRLLQAVTPEYGRDYLDRFGFDPARWPAVLPIALGAGSATPLQVANAYSVLANGGYLLTPYLIDRVVDHSGKVLMRAQPQVAGDERVRAVDPRTVWLVDDILRETAVKGTAARVHRTLQRNDLAGKTGTTNGAADVWFSGYNRDMVTTVWMGFDQPRSLGSNEFGSGLALSTWLDYSAPMFKGKAETPRRPMPQGLIADRGNYYYSEFPPGQAIASLDLDAGDALTDFLEQLQPIEEGDARIRQPQAATPSPIALPVPVPHATPAPLVGGAHDTIPTVDNTVEGLGHVELRQAIPARPL